MGTNADALAAGLGEHGATKVYAVDPGDALPGVVGAAALAALVGEHSPTRCCSRRPTTAATRSLVCR